MNRMRLFLMMLLWSMSSLAFGQTNFQVNTAKSPCHWTGKAAVGLYSIEGTLEIRSGNLLIKDDSLLKVVLKVDLTSLETDNKTMKEHLKGKDFFDVDSFPEAGFIMPKPRLLQEGAVVVTGEIEVKGKRKLIKVPMESRLGKKKIEMKGVLVLDRTEFGIIYNSPNFFDNLGDQAISDDIEFRFDLVFEKD